MPYQISTSRFSFIQFAESDLIESCNFSDSDMCLPVYDENDIWFQFVITAGTQDEADDLCDITNSNVVLGIVQSCSDGFLLQFSQKPSRYRLNATQVLYYWPHGLPGFASYIDIGECFHIKVSVFAQTFCTNCLQRIKDTCFTSVIEYTNNENAFDFNYCASETAQQGGSQTDCDPLVIEFTLQDTMTIPWTAYLQNKYGDTPTIQVWIYDGSELVAAGLRVALDQFPPTEIRIDFGGTASGIVKIM